MDKSVDIILDVVNVSKIFPIKRSIFIDLGISKNDSNSGDVTALSNISFSVKKGEAFGIIGRNGSGKSTLLQIITGTLRVTTGSVFTKGRISALLELGSGFNPDFTGKENIYLGGAILGISKKEMDERYHEIVAFADIGNFLHQPVRTYSSGMLMRVAFAVAVSVEPDILIIDEALSVGDILFQQKCNQRIKELVDKGVTLLVVTHDTSFVLNICNRALWLDYGRVEFLGDASSCVKEYIVRMSALSLVTTKSRSQSLVAKYIHKPSVNSVNIDNCKRLGDGDLFISNLWIINQNLISSQLFNIGDWIEVVLQITAKKTLKLVSGGCELRDRHGQVIFATGLRVINQLIDEIHENESRLVSIKFKLEIASGQYTLDVGSGSGDDNSNVWQRIVSAAIIEVIANKDQDVVHGIVRLPYHIEVSRV